MTSWRLWTLSASLFLLQGKGGLTMAWRVSCVFRGAVSWLKAVKDAGAGAHREAELGRHLLSVRSGDRKCQFLAPEHAWGVRERSGSGFTLGRQWQELDVGSFVQNRIKVANGVVAGKVWPQFQNLWPKPWGAPQHKTSMLINSRVFEYLTLSLLVTSRSSGPFPIDQDPFLTSKHLLRKGETCLPFSSLTAEW